jgi:hypothetical protein
MVEAFYLVGSSGKLEERVKEYIDAGVDLPLLLPRLDDYVQITQIFHG